MNRQQELERVKEIIYNHDLTPTIRRMVLINKWSEKHATEACKQYRNYLFLKLKYGHEYDLPPSVDIDEIWHNHILHTEDYTEFCKKAFGHFLHHSPSHNVDDELINKGFEVMFEDQTQNLYHKEFGEYIHSIRPYNVRMKLLFCLAKIVDFLVLPIMKKVTC